MKKLKHGRIQLSVLIEILHRKFTMTGFDTVNHVLSEFSIGAYSAYGVLSFTTEGSWGRPATVNIEWNTSGPNGDTSGELSLEWTTSSGHRVEIKCSIEYYDYSLLRKDWFVQEISLGEDDSEVFYSLFEKAVEDAALKSSRVED